jgi:phosphoribosylpyrophosphate synthetase
MPTVMFHCPQMAKMAARIKAHVGASLDAGKIIWDRFEGGFPDLFVENARSLNGKKALFLACFDTPSTIFEQFSVIRALPFFTGENVTVALPYFPTAQKDRMVKYGEIVTSKSLIELLSEAMPKYVKYEFAIYDIHAKPEIHTFGNYVRPLYLSAMPLLADSIKKLDNAALCYPDEGAWKRFEDERQIFSHMPQIRCEKDRSGGKRAIRIVQGDPRARHVVIVDDLVGSGKTLLATKDALFGAGADAVSAFATHWPCPNESWRGFVNAGFEHIWLTDSCPWTSEAMANQKPFKLLSLASSIAKLVI